LEGSYSPSELSMSEMLDKEFPWVDAYDASRKQGKEDFLEDGKDVDMEQIDEMMRTHSIAELRQKLIIVQQQLYTYYDLVDKHEKCNAKISKVEEENGKVLADKKKYEVFNKRLRLRSKQQKADMSLMEKQLADVKTELAQTKLQLAQAKTQQDHSDALLKSISDKNDAEKITRRSSHSFAQTKAQPTAEQNEIMPRRNSWWPSSSQRRPSASSVSILPDEKDIPREESASIGSGSCAISLDQIDFVPRTVERQNISRNNSCLSLSSTVVDTISDGGILKKQSKSSSSKRNSRTSLEIDRLLSLSITAEHEVVSRRESSSAISNVTSIDDLDTYLREFSEEKVKIKEKNTSAAYHTQAHPVLKTKQKSRRKSGNSWLASNFLGEKTTPREEKSNRSIDITQKQTRSVPKNEEKPKLRSSRSWLSLSKTIFIRSTDDKHQDMPKKEKKTSSARRNSSVRRNSSASLDYLMHFSSSEKKQKKKIKSISIPGRMSTSCSSASFDMYSDSEEGSLGDYKRGKSKRRISKEAYHRRLSK